MKQKHHVLNQVVVIQDQEIAIMEVMEIIMNDEEISIGKE